MKNINKNSVKKILVITLSNIGDVILTLPVFFVLRREFQGADIYVLVGERAASIFRKDPRIKEVIIYDKKSPLIDKMRLGFKLREEKFGLVVDLRNTLYPLFIGARYRTPLIKLSADEMHKKDIHLAKLRPLGINVEDAEFSLRVDADSQNYADRLLGELGVKDGDRFVLIAPGGKSHIKRWTPEGFV